MKTALVRVVSGTLLASVAALLLASCATTPRPAKAPLCSEAPYSDPLFVRAKFNDFTPREDARFGWHCDAYYLNLDLQGEQVFRIADAKLGGGIAWGGARGEPTPLQDGTALALSGGIGARTGELRYTFHGPTTLRLAFTGHGDALAATLSAGAPTFHERGDAPVTDAVAKSLRFDSRDGAFKQPFGAVTAGSTIEVALSALPGVESATLVVEKRRLEGWQEVLDYTEVARVPLTRKTNGARERWEGGQKFAEIGIYGYWFEVKIAGVAYVVENNADTIFWTRELGSGGAAVVSAMPDRDRIRRYRQTVYRADFSVPDWAQHAVYYYIFPDRFRNGDKTNDPRPGVDKYHDKTVEFHQNWLDKPWVPKSGDGSDDQYANDFFGGDLAGIIEKLDYIAGLGANTLYINPIFLAASNHKYDTADYRRIDPHFGTIQEFERLNAEAARRGIRVVLDTSLNHTGRDSLFFNQYGNYPEVGAFDRGQVHPESKYASWYTFYPNATNPERRYKGWAGIDDLPELDKSQRAVRDYFYGSDGVMQYWLDRGLSGWRMDVAPWVPDDFWREWRAAVKAKKPDAVTIAETFFDASKFFLGDEFDGTMNYIFRNTAEAYANGASARDVYRNIELMRENYPAPALHAVMNLLSTHDVPRALYDFGWQDEHADAATVARAKQRLRLAAFLQMTMPGAPAVYYGDEVGMTGANDPFDRLPYPWADLGGQPDTALFADYQALIRQRHDLPVLSEGALDAPAFLDDHVIALWRRGAGQWAVTASNNDSVAHPARIGLPADANGMAFVDAKTGESVSVANGALSIDVAPMSGRVLVAQGTAQPNVHVLQDVVTIPGLDRTRTLRIYLPPGYDASKKRYPVVYMHDGQNLFDIVTGYAGEWGVDETLNDLARSKGLELIVVGIDNGGAERIHELNAWDNPRFGKGEGRQYVDFLVDVVKPYVDSHYRTKPGRMDTAVAGSSMGGLISHYAIATHPQVFGRALIFSPAYWLAPPIFDDGAQTHFAAGTRLYFYAGGNEEGNTSPEFRHMLPDMQRMVGAVRAAGSVPPSRIAVHVVDDAQHNEAAWRAEFPRAITWLFEH